MCYRRSQLKRKINQQGTVIVLALFIVALAATLSYAMMSRLSRDVARTNLIINDIQAELYAQGAIAWAKDVLIQNWQQQKPNQVIDKLPIYSPKDEINGYQISSVIYDAQSRFNINNLTAEALEDFTRLIKNVMPEVTDEQGLNIARATIDWVTPRQQDNEYNQYYLHLPLPYRAAHRPMMAISEWGLVKGMTANLFAKLSPYLTALPVGTLTNIQYASVPVLMMLSKNMTLDAAKALRSWLDNNKNFSKEIVAQLELIKNNHISVEKMAFVSQFFLLETKVMIGEQSLMLYTLLQRDAGAYDNSKPAVVRIDWQSKNLSA